MSEELKPFTLTAADIEAVALSTVRAVIGDVRYQYLSGPITGGRALLEWHETSGRELDKASYPSAKTAVLTQNIASLRRLAKCERDACRNTIEPGSFEAEFEHWGQDDFLRFWEKVIAEHASVVKFIDGWEFSSGCAYELLCARQYQIPTIDMRGAELTNQIALSLLDRALGEIDKRHIASDERDAEIVKLRDKITNCRAKIAALD